MSIFAAAPRFALIATGILMVVLAAVASVLTTPSSADATATKTIESSVSIATETGLASGANASGSIGSVG